MFSYHPGVLDVLHGVSQLVVQADAQRQRVIIASRLTLPLAAGL